MKILTLDDQIKLLDGKNVWETKTIEDHKGILMTDGPHGVRKQIDFEDSTGNQGSVKATCFPPACLTACSFDRQVLKKLGTALAKECRHYGVQMILGPGINIKRSPLNGRNFEYFSEDPYVSGELGASFVRAVEDMGIGTSLKHFIVNNQETNRFTIDAIVDERALHEIYYKNFKRVVDEKPASVMVSYNKLNGYYLSEHPMIKDVLRNKWNYQGLIVSDWGAVDNRIASVKAGCDLEMPSSRGYWYDKLNKESQVDDALSMDIRHAAQRVINLSKQYKTYDNQETIDFEKQNEQARMIARESMVLTKNQNDMLPIDKSENVAIISGFAYDMRYQGGGSSHVNAAVVKQIDDIKTQYSKNIKVAKGFETHLEKPIVKLEQEAIEIANQSKKVIYIVGLPEKKETEGFDRTSIDLPYNQIALFEKLQAVNPNIILVVVGGSVVNLRPFKQSKAVLIAYLGGQAASLAMMDILYGKVSPSGRLAETWIDDLSTCNVSITKDNHATYYDESIFVGYRYYETFKKQVRYHFGHGLSYAKFVYKDFKVEKVNDIYQVSVMVRNIGSMVAKEVVMIFVGQEDSATFKAKRELKRFEKIELKPNEAKEVTFALNNEDFMFYDIRRKKFIIEDGIYNIECAKHANDIIDGVQIHINGFKVVKSLMSYNQYEYNPSDFSKVYQQPLPPKHVVRKRPFNLSVTLNEVNHLFVGRLVKRAVMRQANKMFKDAEDNWVKEVMRKTMMETPIRMLSLFSNGDISLYQAEGIVDILNLHFLKGIKKLKSK